MCLLWLLQGNWAWHIVTWWTRTPCWRDSDSLQQPPRPWPPPSPAGRLVPTPLSRPAFAWSLLHVPLLKNCSTTSFSHMTASQTPSCRYYDSVYNRSSVVTPSWVMVVGEAPVPMTRDPVVGGPLVVSVLRVSTVRASPGLHPPPGLTPSSPPG